MDYLKVLVAATVGMLGVVNTGEMAAPIDGTGEPIPPF